MFQLFWAHPSLGAQAEIAALWQSGSCNFLKFLFTFSLIYDTIYMVLFNKNGFGMPRIMKQKVRILIAALSIIISLSLALPAAARANSPRDSPDSSYMLVREVVASINEGDVPRYISLFDAQTQVWMNQYVNDFGTANFFAEEHIEILNIKKLSYETGLRAA